MTEQDAPAPQPGTESEEPWRSILLGTDERFRRGRSFFKHLPASPRCKMCGSPFGGPIGRALRIVGKAPWSRNPKYCGGCFTILQAHHGGAEVPCSVLFADIRGSTSLAERMSPSAFRDLLNRFYREATRVLVDRDAIVDKFVGDEVMAIFIPALTMDAHAARAIDAARSLLEATGGGPGRSAGIPIGVGIATGTAYVGSVGTGDTTELTALGDIVNVGARLASAARAGEILVTRQAALEAHLPADVERRTMDLRGKSEPVEVAVVRVGSTAP